VAVEELLDESVIYDLKTNKAHSLNRTATLVWRHCDGHTTVTQMATCWRRSWTCRHTRRWYG